MEVVEKKPSHLRSKDDVLICIPIQPSLLRKRQIKETEAIETKKNRLNNNLSFFLLSRKFIYLYTYLIYILSSLFTFLAIKFPWREGCIEGVIFLFTL